MGSTTFFLFFFTDNINVFNLFGHYVLALHYSTIDQWCLIKALRSWSFTIWLNFDTNYTSISIFLSLSHNLHTYSFTVIFIHYISFLNFFHSLIKLVYQSIFSNFTDEYLQLIFTVLYISILLLLTIAQFSRIFLHRDFHSLVHLFPSFLPVTYIILLITFFKFHWRTLEVNILFTVYFHIIYSPLHNSQAYSFTGIFFHYTSFVNFFHSLMPYSLNFFRFLPLT